MAALILAGAALWAAWNIYSIAINHTAGGRSLVGLSRHIGLKFPDFVKWFDQDSRAVSLGLYILAIIGILFGLLSTKNVNVLPQFSCVSAPPRPFPRHVRFIALIAGLVCVAIVLPRALNDKAGLPLILLWIVYSVCFGLVISDRREGRPDSLLSRGEWLGLGILTAVSAVFYMCHSTWWLYSHIGDEYAFLGLARDLASGARYANPFSPVGYYDLHFSWMIGFYQAGIMKILGVNNFGWRASSAIAASICFIPFYYFMKYFFSRTAAVMGTGVMACSHYLTTWARIGKPHNNANFFLCMAFALYAYCRRFPSRTRYYIFGSIMGLGFYFFQPAKFCLLFILIVYLVDLFKEKKLRRWEYPVCFLIGMFVVAAPNILHPGFCEGLTSLSKIAMFTANIGGTIKPLNGSMSAGISIFIGKNMFEALISPFCIYASHHFLYRSYMDPASAALFALGLCWSIVWVFRRRQAAMFVVTFIVALAMAAGIARYPNPSPTRVLLLFPWWAAFSGIGAWRLIELGYSFSSRRRFWWSFCGLALVSILVLNLYQLYVVVPANYPKFSPFMMVLREAQSVPAEQHIYFIADKEDKYSWTLEMLMPVYDFGSRFHQVYSEDLFDGSFFTMLIRPSMVIVDNKNSKINHILELIRKRFPNVMEKDVLDPTGNLSMHVFHLDRDTDLAPTRIKFIGSYALRSIDYYLVNIVDITGFPNGMVVAIAYSRAESYGVVIPDSGAKIRLWPCGKAKDIEWKNVRIFPEQRGNIWVVCIDKRHPTLGLLEKNGRMVWSKCVKGQQFACGASTNGGKLLVASLRGDKIWEVSPEGDIKEKGCGGLPARDLEIIAMAEAGDGRIYLADRASKSILVLNSDYVFEGTLDAPVKFDKDVRLIAGKDNILYLGTGSTLASIELSAPESEREWDIELKGFSIAGLAWLGRNRIAIGNAGKHPDWYPMIWIAEVYGLTRIHQTSAVCGDRIFL